MMQLPSRQYISAWTLHLFREIRACAGEWLAINRCTVQGNRPAMNFIP